MRKRVAYVEESSVGRFTFGKDHPMLPLRCGLTSDLLKASGVFKNLNLVRPVPIKDFKCHSKGILEALEGYTGGDFDARNDLTDAPDTPFQTGCYEYAYSICCASVTAAKCLNSDEFDVAISWSGGMHHACFDKPYGFCYLNDINEAIMILLERFANVLYIDIDVHHGDGVESYFEADERVTTMSSHFYDGNFFPGTGLIVCMGGAPHLNEQGSLKINIPMGSGLSDEVFYYVMTSCIKLVIEHRRPEAIVLQSGGDSLAGDKLGVFNLTSAGHASVASFLKNFDIPMLVLGGGGYNIQNVPRAWALETAILTDSTLPTWGEVMQRVSGTTQRIMAGVQGWFVSEIFMEERNNYGRSKKLIHYINEYLKKIKINDRKTIKETKDGNSMKAGEDASLMDSTMIMESLGGSGIDNIDSGIDNIDSGIDNIDSGIDNIDNIHNDNRPSSGDIYSKSDQTGEKRSSLELVNKLIHENVLPNPS